LQNKLAGIPEEMTKSRSYEGLKDRFMELVQAAPKKIQEKKYAGPELYSYDRVTYIIPPITDIQQRGDWKPGFIYVVKEGCVAIGRVFYTRTSGEYLIEELVLKPGDIFGEYEIPLSFTRNTDIGEAMLPPRFNMTYGAWASGPSLNWAMAYPRHILRDTVDRDNAKVAVHPFYIKSKNIRPKSEADVIAIPVEYFEETIGLYPEAMTWFLINVLRKTRLYFEPPSEGYGRSPVDTISRLFIRILAYRIRLGFVVCGNENGKTSCRTFIGPTEWLKYGIGAYMADLKEIIHSLGGGIHEPLKLPVFPKELENVLDIQFHFPVKDLDNEILTAMGCFPDEDRRENRYGLLTGVKITLSDLDYFNKYLIEKGE
jgi:CRP-like cAMP-binding protein